MLQVSLIRVASGAMDGSCSITLNWEVLLLGLMGIAIVIGLPTSCWGASSILLAKCYFATIAAGFKLALIIAATELAL